MKQLAFFFVLAYLVSWILWFPLYAPALGIEGLPILTFQHALGSWGPLFAAFVTTIVFDKNKVRHLVGSIIKVDKAWLVIAFFGPFILAIIGLLINSWGKQLPLNISSLAYSNEFGGWGIGTILVYNIITFGLGEEVGWRGFALPVLQRKYSALTASLVITLFWAIWHLPLFLYRPGYMAMDVAGFLGWVLSLLTGSILLTWLFNGSKGSILVCVIFHATVDVVFTAKYPSSAIVNYLGIMITIVGIFVVVIYKPSNLSKNKRIMYVGDIKSN